MRERHAPSINVLRAPAAENRNYSIVEFRISILKGLVQNLTASGAGRLPGFGGLLQLRGNVWGSQ
eukprot:CAMPEP_0180671108 /NCGR_PEP_ID=MMETSP1037_2-20121125/64401_1 /TAXON_ID=632150 /ORGANISM="Azadinium spinosum, Strain 3D9" /LENGTH=64 /DNA_ID=CAMNT_0022700119 /DNA_START=152 /DNA_END=343 /DNA_ORIENTATION=-